MTHSSSVLSRTYPEAPSFLDTSLPTNLSANSLSSSYHSFISLNSKAFDFHLFYFATVPAYNKFIMSFS